MKYICPLIVVEDVDKSRKFYEEVLGQTVQVDFGENITFTGSFSIHQKKHFQTLIEGAPVTQKSNSSELYFEDDDLEKTLSVVKEMNLELVHDLREQPWRQRVFRFYDFDKNMIEIGESMEHVAIRLSEENLSIKEICKITYLPEKTVTEALKKMK